MHKSGRKAIELSKQNGSWTSLDEVENGIVPEDLKKAFDKNPKAFENYKEFTGGQRKGYLYWLNQAKREETRQKRISEIVRLCDANIKYRNVGGR